ncbi:MAG: Re/Si-specific NAD(P)(+) transhydrogenase subunit alpha [Bacteroidota bacterium]|nr:Re/Si-specific NAD(P)(+) transhydrogenase subunit alpha [Bacteroidota bacterium]
MHIGILNEVNDARVALIPDIVKQLVNDKNQVNVEINAGNSSYFSNQDYTDAGAQVLPRQQVLSQSEIIITLSPLEETDLSVVKEKTILISSYQPFADLSYLEKTVRFPVTVLSLDMIPRITIAQAMDVLSSMASIAGYKAVLMAANQLPRYFPMLTTAAGSIPPAKTLVLGAGVAGLQAIATAKRLGSVVEAFDTRLAAREEVQSLGAKFVEVEGARDDKAAGGYAVEQTEEYKQRQAALIQEKAVKSDIIIATAQIRGRKAPLLVTKETIEQMKPGSVIVDLASSTGGNCELTQDKITIHHKGITIIGNSDLAATMPMHSSQLFSKNIFNFMKVFLKQGQLNFDINNEIMKASCIMLEGKQLFQKK